MQQIARNCNPIDAIKKITRVNWVLLYLSPVKNASHKHFCCYCCLTGLATVRLPTGYRHVQNRSYRP